MADQEQEVGVIFPLAGIDSTCEFSRQPDSTTPSGINVRAFEVITRRARGGSREGMSRYVNETLNGAHLIQHLNILVDPQNPALDGPNATGDMGGTLEADPSSNNLSVRNFGRYVRIGGSGAVPNRTKRTTDSDGVYAVDLGVFSDADGHLDGSVTYGAGGTLTGQTVSVFVVVTYAGGNKPAGTDVWIVDEATYIAMAAGPLGASNATLVSTTNGDRVFNVGIS